MDRYTQVSVVHEGALFQIMLSGDHLDYIDKNTRFDSGFVRLDDPETGMSILVPGRSIALARVASKEHFATEEKFVDMASRDADD